MRNARPLTQLCRKHGITLAELARRLKRPRNTIKKWGAEITLPAEEIPEVIRAFGGAVSASELRPDLVEHFAKSAA
jgi:DNA-binding transcriptional regulator YdaS (Cro superfamily)